MGHKSPNHGRFDAYGKPRAVGWLDKGPWRDRAVMKLVRKADLRDRNVITVGVMYPRIDAQWEGVELPCLRIDSDDGRAPSNDVAIGDGVHTRRSFHGIVIPGLP